MKTYYKRAPDVFELIVDKNILHEFEIRQIELAHGKDEPKYCFVDEILVGCVLGESEESKDYYRALKIDYSNKTTIQLLPLIQINYQLSFPTIEKFIDVLINFLVDRNGWVVVCEKDCDQYPIDRVQFNNASLSKIMSQIANYCSGSDDCPSFIIGQ